MAGDAPEDQRKIFFGWIVVFVALAITTTAFGVFYSFGVFFKAWLSEWATSRAFLSGIFSVAFLSYGVASVIMGSLTDRYGPRKILVIGGLIMGAGCCLTALNHMAGLMYVTWGVMIGIGVGTSYSPTASTVSRWFNYRKGLAVGVVVSGLGLGTFVFSPLAEFLKTRVGWRFTAFYLGLIVWIVFFAGALIIRRNPEDLGLKPLSRPFRPAEDSAEEGESRSIEGPALPPLTLTLDQAMKQRNFWTLFAVHCFWTIGFSIPLVHLVPYATDLGIKADSAATMLATIGATSVIGRVCLGVLTERMGTRLSLVGLLMFQAGAMIWLIAADRAWMLWGFTLLFGFSYGGLASVFPLATIDYFGLLAMGSIFGVILLGATLGGTIGPALAGLIFDMTKVYRNAFLTGALTITVGAILSFTMKKEPQRRRKNQKNR